MILLSPSSCCSRGTALSRTTLRTSCSCLITRTTRTTASARFIKLDWTPPHKRSCPGQGRRQGTSVGGAFKFLGGGHKSRWAGGVGVMQSVIVCSCLCSRKRAMAFICALFVSDFTFEHVQQGGERMERGSDSGWGGALSTNTPLLTPALEQCGTIFCV